MEIQGCGVSTSHLTKGISCTPVLPTWHNTTELSFSSFPPFGSSPHLFVGGRELVHIKYFTQGHDPQPTIIYQPVPGQMKTINSTSSAQSAVAKIFRDGQWSYY